jgi:choline dehydrogenase-like flavoprotein
VPDVEKYEILVFGSGEAGKYLAWTMAKAGHRTAMVERTPNTRGIGLDQDGVVFGWWAPPSRGNLSSSAVAAWKFVAALNTWKQLPEYGRIELTGFMATCCHRRMTMWLARVKKMTSPLCAPFLSV